ncbi:hypothetical protein C791_3995 [Amycolatopsis azurea DSM 43854]|uniref:Oligopeptide/dipeptide ABC transporter C-terminal domain-containing protein n=1 Tax=Amycolatopsis azurea DSM 43854 TaxID=1238180 RepID=M2PND2_9PSEU|nr:hypothetical protein C791_3995 [Amycolatopsis azurea DSM 43854]
MMHRGHVVEQGPTKEVLTDPVHPYTHRLLSAAPVADPAAQRRRRETWRRLRADDPVPPSRSSLHA